MQRSISKPRELLRALKKLSGYIWHSLHSDKENIWLAHREGRAKDGMDRTEPAIIKMLAIAKPKAVSLSDYINDLSIVPVSISYEFDPCDAIKAKEIRMLSEKQAYAKSEHEDLASIGLGIQGFNGHVNLVFGKPLVVTTNNAEEIARQLDEQIVRNYQLQPTNVIAYLNLYGEHAWAKAQAVLEASERHHVHSQALMRPLKPLLSRAWRLLIRSIATWLYTCMPIPSCTSYIFSMLRSIRCPMVIVQLKCWVLLIHRQSMLKLLMPKLRFSSQQY